MRMALGCKHMARFRTLRGPTQGGLRACPARGGVGGTGVGAGRGRAIPLPQEVPPGVPVLKLMERQENHLRRRIWEEVSSLAVLHPAQPDTESLSGRALPPRRRPSSLVLSWCRVHRASSLAIPPSQTATAQQPLSLLGEMPLSLPQHDSVLPPHATRPETPSKGVAGPLRLCCGSSPLVTCSPSTSVAVLRLPRRGGGR